tara:strand:+ start:525 stop:725 length:201 start_codon:yes stop_codon:yes gene_type:complete
MSITEDNETVARMPEKYSISTLLMSIVHITGDASILRRGPNPMPTCSMIVLPISVTVERTTTKAFS